MSPGKVSQQQTAAYARTASFLAANVRQGLSGSVLFCSAVGGEGTTTVVLNTAMLLARQFNLRVLAVELGWKRPGFARTLSVDMARALSSFAAGRMSASDCVHRSPDGFSYIPLADATLPMGLVDVADTVDRLQRELHNQYDCILFDGPPVVENADSPLAATAIRNVVLVVESGSTRSEVVKRVRQEFAIKGAVLVGAVLTKKRHWIPGWIYRWLMN